MVGPVQDVEEPQLDESPRGLMPAWIERDAPRIAQELIRSHRAAGRQEPQHGDYSRREPLEPRPDRKGGSIRTDRVLEKDIEQDLVPHHVCRVGELRSGDIAARLLE